MCYRWEVDLETADILFTFFVTTISYVPSLGQPAWRRS